MSIQRPADIDQSKFRDISCNFDKLKHVVQAILNGVFSAGVISLGLKSAIVPPLFKRGSKKDVGN